jgi:acyl-CoA synthetase (NDP forming)
MPDRRGVTAIASPVLDLSSDERAAAHGRLRPLLAPRSIALIGASERPRSVGRALLDSIRDGGFTGPLYPVNPRHDELLGLRCYRTVADLPEAVDLALVAVPAEAVPATVEACGARGVRGIVLVSSGFRETGIRGSQREAEMLAAVRRYGMSLIGPNCLGVLNTDPRIRLDATFAPLPMRPGGLGLASQSGALGISVATDAARYGVGLSQFVSLGNKADVSGNDLLMWWAEDPNTKVIALYLESFGNPRRFLQVAGEVARHKPVLALKSGRTDAGQRAGASHTAAAATNDSLVDALCEQAGVVRVDTIEQLLDAVRVLDSQPLPAGPRLAIVGNSGGPEIIAADTAGTVGLHVPPLSEATVAALREVVPDAASWANPVDLGAGMTADQLGGALDVLRSSAEVDAIAVITAETAAVRCTEVSRTVAAHSAAPDQPLPADVAALGSDPKEMDPALPRPFEFPESAVSALATAWRYAQTRNAPRGEFVQPAGLDAVRAKQAIAESEPGWLAAGAAHEVLDAYGVELVDQRVVADEDEAVAAAKALGYPVAMKALGIVHKTDVGGVRLDLRDPREVRRAFAALTKLSASVLIQPMARSGAELIVGGLRDPQLGPVVMLGAGGVYSALIADRRFRIAPLRDVDADAMIAGMRSQGLLDGYRGAAPVDRAALRDLLLRVSALMSAHPEITEIDLNPVIAYGDRLTVVDAKVRTGGNQ